MLYENILAVVGKTPLVKLNRVGSTLACNLYGKCEFLNPGGSVKDRIGVAMLEHAEKQGKVKPGDTIIEATSGNTGIGIAIAGAVKGYKVIITMPEKMSHEKQVVLEALGAKIYRTPTEAAWDSPESHITLAKKLNAKIPHSYILNQYTNPENTRIHYETTALEIWNDLNGKVNMVVMTVGTGGTITGVAKKLKELDANVKIIGVDPHGSILGGGTEVKPYLVEGIGYDFIPDVLDNSLIDQYIKINDKDTFCMARRLIREEGLLIGGSSGGAVWAAIQAANSLKTGQNCVVLLPDSVRNYLTKFVDDKWMTDNHLISL